MLFSLHKQFQPIKISNDAPGGWVYTITNFRVDEGVRPMKRLVGKNLNNPYSIFFLGGMGGFWIYQVFVSSKNSIPIFKPKYTTLLNKYFVLDMISASNFIAKKIIFDWKQKENRS